MKKQFISLLCAAGMVLTSVPALPVFAEKNSTESRATDQREITEDGDLMASASAGDGTWLDCFNVGNAGTVDYTAGICGGHQFSWKNVKNAQFELISQNSDLRLPSSPIPGITYNYAAEFDLGNTGWYGLSVPSPYSNWVYIVEGWAENSTIRSSAGTKLGTVSAEGLEYEVYRCDQQDEDQYLRIPGISPVYWLFSTTNRYDGHDLVKGAVPVCKLISQLYDSGLDAEMMRPDHSSRPDLLVYSGLDTSGKASGSAKFKYCWYGNPPLLEDGIIGTTKWEAESAYNLGTFDASVEEDGSFSFSWNDAERAYYLYHPYGVSTESERDFAVGKTWKYAGEADLGGYGYFGAFFRQTIYNSREFIIVEGYGEKCTAWGSDQPLGEISVGKVRYDLYQTDWYSNSGDIFKLTWIVRKDNQYSGANCAFSGEVPVAPIMEQVVAKLVSEKYGVTMPGPAMQWLVDSDRSETEMVSGSVHFTKCVFEETDNYFTESGRKDGYNWARIQKAYDHGTSMTVGENGTFTAEWKNLDPALKVLFVCGREYNVKLDEIKSLNCAYEISGSKQFHERSEYGFVSTFADTSGTEPVLTECYFACPDEYAIDGSKQILGEFQIGDYCYFVEAFSVDSEPPNKLTVTPQHYTKQQYWIRRYQCSHQFVNGELIINEDPNGVDLLAVFKELEKLGVKLDGVLTDVSFFVQPVYGADNCRILKNEINLVQEGTAAPESNVRGDANCDGVLDVSDAVLTARMLTEDIEAKITGQGKLNADIDLSGKLEMSDITLMLQVIAKKVKL